jgi:hypothetical protein
MTRKRVTFSTQFSLGVVQKTHGKTRQKFNGRRKWVSRSTENM